MYRPLTLLAFARSRTFPARFYETLLCDAMPLMLLPLHKNIRFDW